MEKQIEEFLREVTLSASDANLYLRTKALDLLLANVSSNTVVRNSNPVIIIGNSSRMIPWAVYDEIAIHLYHNRKIPAIKALRTAIAGLDLKLAKDAVENPTNFSQKREEFPSPQSPQY